MTNEQYVTYETAKLLKEKGFDWGTDKVYERNLMVCRYEDYPMPTQQMACNCVEKTYDFFIEIARSIDLNGNYHYFYMILDKTCKYASSATSDNDYSSKSDAIEAALQYVLTNLV